MSKCMSRATLPLSSTGCRNPDKVSKIITTLGLKVPPREQKSKDTRQLLSAMFSQWLPLSTCVIQTIVDIVPPPSAAQRIRIPKMLYPDIYETTIEPKNKLEEVLYSCNDAPDAPIVALISKMFAVPTKELPGKKKKALTADEMRSRAKAAREAHAAAKTQESTPSETSTTVLEDALQNVELADKPEDADADTEGDAGGGDATRFRAHILGHDPHGHDHSVRAPEVQRLPRTHAPSQCRACGPRARGGAVHDDGARACPGRQCTGG